MNYDIHILSSVLNKEVSTTWIMISILSSVLIKEVQLHGL